MSKLDDLRRRYSAPRKEEEAPEAAQAPASVGESYKGRRIGPTWPAVEWTMEEVAAWTKAFKVRSSGATDARGVWVMDLTYIHGPNSGKGFLRLAESSEGRRVLRETWQAYKGREDAAPVRFLIERIIIGILFPNQPTSPVVLQWLSDMSQP